MLAAHRGQDPSRVRYRRDDALAVAHWRHLDHLVATNGFFCALARAARDRPERALAEWWSERRCTARWGGLVRPDGYGRWRDRDAETDFFVEVDRATEPPGRLAAKLAGYRDLAAATQITTPVLFWLPTPAREATVRVVLGTPAIPVATAAATTDRGSRRNPAEPVWLWLGSSAPRLPLAALAHRLGGP